MSSSRPGRPVPPRRPATTRPPAKPEPKPEPKTSPPAKPEPSPRPRPRPKPKPSSTVGPSSSVTTYTSGRRALGLPLRPAIVSTGSAQRFAERDEARRRALRRKAYLVAGGVTAALALGWLLLLSPVLALEPAQVTVTGAGTVVAVADVNAVVAGVAGMPLPRLDTVGLRDRVLDVPGVRAAKVARVWPHGLMITLVSREPVVAVPQPPPAAGPAAGQAAGFTLLDTDGYQVGWAEAAPEGLPVITVPVTGENKRILTAVLTVLQALPPELRAEVATVAATSQDTVQMGLRDGVSVNWGSASQAALKVAVLKALRAAPATAGARELDVSAPTLPVTR